jgi:hypothetical protein
MWRRKFSRSADWMDRGSSGIISLRRLAKDLKRNFKLLTRENYVCYDGLPYDYRPFGRHGLKETRGRGDKAFGRRLKVPTVTALPNSRTCNSTRLRASIRRSAAARIAFLFLLSRPSRNGSTTAAQTIWLIGVTPTLRTPAIPKRDRRSTLEGNRRQDHPCDKSSCARDGGHIGMASFCGRPAECSDAGGAVQSVAETGQADHANRRRSSRL